MNVVFVLADSLNRHFLRCYGGGSELDVATPNIDRLARRSLVLDRHYAGSLPCMPARRELLAGVQEFLWRPWGPMEPFDTSLALAARRAGVLTQLVTDHYHYFQHGSAGYCDDYHAFDFIRGHEFDAWKTAPAEPDPILLRRIGATAGRGEGDGRFLDRAAYARNVAGFSSEEDFFPARVFGSAASWIADNADREPWLLVIDSFDVHEPFHCPEPYVTMYSDEDPRDPDLTVWPRYGRIDVGPSALTGRQVAYVRAQYAGKLTMWDRWFGRLLDQLDRSGLWDSTMVVLTTDHGHYLGEHGWMGKPRCPVYNVLAHLPTLIWHPAQAAPGHLAALTSAPDLYATMLETLGADAGAGPHSRSLLPLIRGERTGHREWALYGYWGGSVNVTDGTHTYLRPYRADAEVACYSTMFINPWDWFTPVVPPTDATSGRHLPHAGTPVWRYHALARPQGEVMLFNTAGDPDQAANLAGSGTAEERAMEELLRCALDELQAPPEVAADLGLR